MLSMGSMKLDPSKDMAVIAYDINKKVKDMSVEDFEKVRLEKVERRGAFHKKIYLEESE